MNGRKRTIQIFTSLNIGETLVRKGLIKLGPEDVTDQSSSVICLCVAKGMCGGLTTEISWESDHFNER